MAYSFIVGEGPVEGPNEGPGPEISTGDSSPLQVRITLSEEDCNNDGIMDLRISLEVVGGYLADLRGFFFNVNWDFSEGPLVLHFDDGDTSITTSAIDPDGDLTSIGSNSNNINGLQLNGAQASFEIALEIGTQGIGNDDIDSISFCITADTDLSYDLLVGEYVGIRAMSVGDGRDGSSKIGDDVPPPPGPPPPEECFQGLSHGFWKNHESEWDCVLPTDSFEALFGIDTTWTLPGNGKKATTISSDDVTLAQALALQGGGQNALAREAVAAYLNSVEKDIDINYKFSTADVIGIVQDGFTPGGDYDATSAKDTLEAQNTLGLCYCDTLL